MWLHKKESRMPARKKPNRTRPFAIRVMATEAEKRTLRRAAKKARMPLSGFVREAALDKVRETSGRSHGLDPSRLHDERPLMAGNRASG